MTKMPREELTKNLPDLFAIERDRIKLKNYEKFKEKFLEPLVYHSIFEEDQDTKDAFRAIIRETAIQKGAIPGSIQAFYEAKSEGKYKNLTVPAINIRGLTYDTARAVFRCALRNDSKSLIFEIAKSEIGYTKQRPAEYSSVILAAALKEGYEGPIFLQGDHFQINAKKYKENPSKEIQDLKNLIREAIQADFYNIDIDASTIVDLKKKTIKEQQTQNFEVTSTLTTFIRENEPKGITISVGGEIGEVGGQNSTAEELTAFLEGFKESFEKSKPKAKGLSKISVQTGTSHGGVVLPDGSIAKVKIDFKTLSKLSSAAKKMGLAGAVQHGASTLPEDAFDNFPETDAAEIHLATGFQNIIYDSLHFPGSLKNRIIEYIHDNFISEKKGDQTDEQFIYKTRKKAFGPFKKEIVEMPPQVRDAIGKELEDRFELLFKKLNAINTSKAIEDTIEPKIVLKKLPDSLNSLLGS